MTKSAVYACGEASKWKTTTAIFEGTEILCFLDDSIKRGAFKRGLLRS